MNWKRKPVQYSLGDYVLSHCNRFPMRPVPKGGAKDILWYGPYLVVRTTGGSIVARFSPTLGGEVRVAHEYLNYYRLELVDDQDSDAEDIQMDSTEGTDEAAAPEDEADLVQNKAGIPLYNTREMKSQGNYIMEQLLKAAYRQGWRFLTQWAGYPVSDATWEPVKAFVHANEKLNKSMTPKYDTPMRAARRLSEKYKEYEEVEESTSARPQEAKAFSESSSSLRGMPDL